MEDEAAQPTVLEAVVLFASKQLAGKKSAPAMRYRLDRLVKHLGDRKLRDLTRKDFIIALEKIAEAQIKGKPAKQLAGEVLIHAKRLWRFAVTRKWIDASCLEALSRKDIDARSTRRNVALRLDELAELWRALGDPKRCKSDDITVAALRLLILTGQREREVTDAEWSEFDLDAGVWRIPAIRTKSGRAHLVHLAPAAVAILRALQPRTGKKRHVFPSPLRRNQPIFGRSVNNALAGAHRGAGFGPPGRAVAADSGVSRTEFVVTTLFLCSMRGRSRTSRQRVSRSTARQRSIAPPPKRLDRPGCRQRRPGRMLAPRSLPPLSRRSISGGSASVNSRSRISEKLAIEVGRSDEHEKILALALVLLAS